MLKKIISAVLIICMLFSLVGCASTQSQPASQAEVNTEQQQTEVEEESDLRQITDLIGREVLVPKVPKRIAAMTGPSYEMVFMLGGKDMMAMTKSGHTTNYPIALLTNPDLANYEGIGANPSSSVNIEDYLSREIDLVIYYDNDNELQKFEVAEIPAIVLTLNTGIMESIEEVKTTPVDEYIEESVAPVLKLAEVIDGDAVEEAQKWAEYCEEKINMLHERTKDLSDDELKTVYWGNTWGENILSTYALKNRYYEIRLCGGELLGPIGGNGNFPEVTAEQLFDWDPEYILVDNHGNVPELVIKHMYKEGSKWETLSAVKNENLHRIPAGVFFLDKGTTTTLMMLWLATIIQPEIFSDIDIIEEVKYYYSEFYEYELTDDQAQKVIDGWYDRPE